MEHVSHGHEHLSLVVPQLRLPQKLACHQDIDTVCKPTVVSAGILSSVMLSVELAQISTNQVLLTAFPAAGLAVIFCH